MVDREPLGDAIEVNNVASLDVYQLTTWMSIS